MKIVSETPSRKNDGGLFVEEGGEGIAMASRSGASQVSLEEGQFNFACDRK